MRYLNLKRLKELLREAVAPPSQGRHARPPGQPRPGRPLPQHPPARTFLQWEVPTGPTCPSLMPDRHVIRPYYLEWERQQAQQRADRSRLGIGVLTDIASTQLHTELTNLVRAWHTQGVRA